YGNTYFARYFDWQGMCREKFMSKVIMPGQTYEGVFLTQEAHHKFLKETFPFQELKVLLNTNNVRRCSLMLCFRFMHEGTLVGTGWQQIVCAGQDRNIQRFPDFVIERA